MGVNTAGVNVFGGAPPLTYPATTGRVFYVGSVAVPGGVVGADVAGAHGDSPHRPFATVDYAVGQCTASRGDVIYVLPGHSETITAAAGLDADVAGISIIGLGWGRNRPTINYSTAASADMDIDAANITIENMIIDVTGVDALTNPIDVNAADFTLRNCELICADADGQATEVIVTATAADRMKVEGCTFRGSSDTGLNNVISIEGTPDGIEIAYNSVYGDFADACIHNPTSNVATNVKIHHNFLWNQQNGDHAIELVSACTGVIHDNMLVTDAIATAGDFGACTMHNNWYADDGDTDAAAVPFPETVTTGGSSLSQIADRLGSDADTDAIGAVLTGSAGVATFPSGAAAANGVNLAEVLRYTQENIIVGSGTALPSNTSLYGVLAGASGVTTYPASAAPANAVSMAEVLRAIYNAVSCDGAADSTVAQPIGRRVTKVGDVSGTEDRLFTVTGKCLITHLVGEVTSVIATTTSLQLRTSTNDIVLHASTDIVTDVVGTLYMLSGDPDDVLNGGSVPQADVAFIKTGTISPIMMNDDAIDQIVDQAGTGLIQWDLYYIPLEDSASIASAA